MKETFYERIGEAVCRERLTNGLEVCVVPKPGYAKKYAFFSTRYGGMDTRFCLDGQWLNTPAGIAHYLEHKMFDTREGNALQELAKNGAEPNAFTANAMTAYYFDSTEHFEENLRILLSFVSIPYFTDESVAKEQGIIGARFYYVLFYLDLYRNTDGSLDWGAMFRIWDGGLAIYGAVIAGVLVALAYTKRHKLPFFAMGDVAVMGLLLGQIIGRWANFINREAFGGETTLPWRMKLWVSQYTSIEVHPTFFYESFWNLIGLLLILFIVSKGRRFDGENTWFYFLWYGLGRSWIEGLRTDSLYLFNWELFGQRIRVSQALSIVMVAVAAFMLFYNIRIKKRSPESLWVHQVAAEKARLAAAEAEDAVLAETLMNEVPTEGEAADPLETEAVESPDAETVPDTETQEKPEKGETHGNEN